MNPADPSEPKKQNRWKRPGFLIFVGVNVLGVVIAIPLISAVYPLMSIWWNTRSQESVQRYVERSTSAETNRNSFKVAQPAEPSINNLTNQLAMVEGLSEAELSKIVAHQFGAKKETTSDPSKFDRDSAVFHDIQRIVRVVNGLQLYCYEVDLVDQNGNHRKQLDCFEEPDPDYERSMATLQLVQSNPQLKKIYSAFAHVLAEQSSNPTNANPNPSTPPVIRLEKP